MVAPPVSHRRLAGIFLGLALALAATGCKRRYTLTPDRLADVKARAGTVEGIRTYPHRRFTIRYPEEQVDESVETGRDVRIVRTQKPKIRRFRPRDAGKIVATDELNQMPILWVSYDPSCNEAACALGFVQTEDQRFRLALVPRLDDYNDPEVYLRRVTKRKIKKLKWMRLGNVRAADEANFVYIHKPRKRAKTIELDLRLDLRERERPDVETPGGYD